ncbi:unnamed protein product [Linum trigynum]|uniref:EF-hand domain-containing protein n=1 Tax=Linum trigynum TaxID=586398 RepID=A0AAV2CJ13_9ROSI
MSDGGMTVLDGTHLRSLRLSIPDSAAALTGAQVLDLAESAASNSLFDLPLPPALKSAALSRLNVDDPAAFHNQELTRESATAKLDEYLAAIADELRENPMVISILDGSTLRVFLEDEDDFAMLAENLFTDLDSEDKGKIKKIEIRNALLRMGVETGIPPFEEFPVVNDILKKHGVQEEGELGQSQFAELLQPILQEVADALLKRNVVVVHNTQILNGSKLRKLLADEEQLNTILAKVLDEKHKAEDNLNSKEMITSFLDKHAKEVGLPSSEANEAVTLVYDAVFAEVGDSKFAADEDDQFRELVKEVLEKLAEQLEASPMYSDI